MHNGATPAAGAGTLSHYLTPINVWALSFGCILGWGAFVMPATTLLPIAGPVGTIVAMGAAGVIIFIIAVNFHFMLNRYPTSGGAFVFTRHLFGHDHAFLCAWSLVLAYISILWANATAFILISRFLLGPVFQFGFHYQVAGYDVYAGEILVTLIVLGVFGLISCGRKRLVTNLNTALAFVLLFGVIACFLFVWAGGANTAGFAPAFEPEGVPAVEVFNIVALAPWAFLGFESVAQGAGEFNFPVKRLLPILAAAIGCGALVYMLTTAISVLGMPFDYQNWMAYLADLGNREGLEGLPTFHAARAAAGQLGLAVLAAAVVAAMSTSLIGLYRATSRLLYSMAEDGMLPKGFAKLNGDGVPRNAILFVMCISAIVPFVGRAAIGWIVDVTSISAAIAYGYASACSLRVSWDEKNRLILATSVIGLAMSAAFFFFPLIPNLWSMSALAPESYLILAAWAMLGLLFFRLVFRYDTENRFGKSTIVWISMLFLIFFASTMWMRQATNASTESIVGDVSAYYAAEYAYHGLQVDRNTLQREEAYLAEKTEEMRSSLMDDSLVQMGLIVVSLIIMFNIYSLMTKRERELNLQRLEAEESSKAKTTFLSNMSHDIRTPMNAIIGYTHLARREGTTLEEAEAYLEKIDASSKHLLALINDVLEMSRIESGKMDLDLVETDLRKTMGEVRDMFATQMAEKKIAYSVDAAQVEDGMVLCDKNRLNRVLLNLLSNAYKFTPEGGSVSVTLRQLGGAPEGSGDYELRVKDSGIGMTAEFAAKVFEAFERERNSTVSGIQGTGLGMAITKSIVDLMGGTIDVETAPGEGTEFIIHVRFEVLAGGEEAGMGADDGEAEVDFTGKRLLLVEDNEINREIASLILEDAGFELDTAENGQIAVDKVSASEPGWYDAILMDVQMPVLNGYDATRAIRRLDDPALAGIPIVAASANAFAEDVQAAREAGMDAHLSKPLDVPKVMQVLSQLLAE